MRGREVVYYDSSVRRRASIRLAVGRMSYHRHGSLLPIHTHPSAIYAHGRLARGGQRQVERFRLWRKRGPPSFAPHSPAHLTHRHRSGLSQSAVHRYMCRGMLCAWAYYHIIRKHRPSRLLLRAHCSRSRSPWLIRCTLMSITMPLME